MTVQLNWPAEIVNRLNAEAQQRPLFAALRKSVAPDSIAAIRPGH